MLVSNTSTLVLLAKVGCLEMFIEISPLIEIPSQVEQEALFEKDSYYARLIQKLIQDKRIMIVNASKDKIKAIVLQFRLDEGEAAAYAVFDSKRHNAVLTDDGELIKLCKLQSIPFTCAMAAVVRLYDKKRLGKEETLGKLEALHKIGRYTKEIYEHFKAEVN